VPVRLRSRKPSCSLYLLSQAELLRQGRTLLPEELRFIRDASCNKMAIHANTIDVPGENYHQVIDYLESSGFALVYKTVVVIVLAPTKSNNDGELDTDYIKDQYYTVTKLWSAVLQSKRIKKPIEVIAFVNKCDLFKQQSYVEKEFSPHIASLKKSCRGASIPFHLIYGSSITRLGMTELEKILVRR